MLRLSVTLAAALWAGFVIWGEPLETTAQDAEAPIEAARPAPIQTSAVVTYATPTIIGAQKAQAVAESPQVARAVIAPLVPLNTTVIEEPTPEPVAAPEPEEAPLFTVTGTRVNLRAGPSTDNPVVASLTLGTVTEAIGPEVDGWIEIRDLGSGVQGFMAARFLEEL